MSIQAEIKSRTVAHSCRDIEFPITCVCIFSFWTVPSFVATKSSLAHTQCTTTNHGEIEGCAMGMTSEEECRFCECFSSFFESVEEIFEAIRIVQEYDMEICLAIGEEVNIGIEENISIGDIHDFEMIKEGMNTVYIYLCIATMNSSRISGLRHEVKMIFFFEKFFHARKIEIFFVVIADDAKVLIFFCTSEKYISHLGDILFGGRIHTRVPADKISSMKNKSIICLSVLKKSLNTIRHRRRHIIDISSYVRISHEEK